eukprot:763136-Hanusia_phi.AAC.9
MPAEEGAGRSARQEGEGAMCKKVARLKEKMRQISGRDRAAEPQRVLSVEESESLFCSQHGKSERLWHSKSLNPKLVDRVVVRQLESRMATNSPQDEYEQGVATIRTGRGRLSQTALRLRVKLGAAEYLDKMKDSSDVKIYDYIDFISNEISWQQRIDNQVGSYRRTHREEFSRVLALEHQLEQSRSLIERSTRVLP